MKPAKPKSKYNNKKVEMDGHTFDSKAEAAEYRRLKDLLASGKITNLGLQPRFELQPAFRRKGRVVRKIEYVADFAYWESGVHVVVDVKGVETEAFKLKAKLFQFRYPAIDFRLVGVKKSASRKAKTKPVAVAY